MNPNPRKAAVIGCGFVGASIAFRFLQQGLFSELVLLDANQAKAEGEAIDLSDGLPYAAPMTITAGTYDDITDCALVVITAGANQKPGETRLVLTYTAWKLSGYPRERVIGSGTVLDTGRLKQLLGEELGVDSRNVHAFIIGEHGDSELAVWSEANVSGLDLQDYYGIAMAVGRIAESLVKDEHAVLPVSVVLEGEYGLEGLALSIPSIVGREGLEEVLEIPLSGEEAQALRQSAKQMEEAIASLNL